MYCLHRPIHLTPTRGQEMVCLFFPSAPPRAFHHLDSPSPYVLSLSRFFSCYDHRHWS